MSAGVAAKRASVGLFAACALASCGGGTTAVPYPNGPWAAGDQRTFIGVCSADASHSFCNCALGAMMQQYHNTHDLPDTIREAGRGAAEYKNYFPACEGK